MSKELRVHWSYALEGHFAVYPVDYAFYRELPDVETDYVDTQGRPTIPLPMEEQVLTVLGSALLSSTVLAAAIKAWLESRRTRIEVSVDGTEKKVTFEGPNLRKSVPEIEYLIDKLSDRDSLQVRVWATRLPEPEASE